MELGEAIKQYRKEHDLSTRAFARACGLSATYMLALENGVTQRGNKPTPSLETYRAVANAMGCSLDDLLRRVSDDVRLTQDEPNKAALIAAIENMSRDELLATLEAVTQKLKEK